MNRIKDVSVGMILLVVGLFIYSDHGECVPQLDEIVISIGLFALGIIMIISGLRKIDKRDDR